MTQTTKTDTLSPAAERKSARSAEAEASTHAAWAEARCVFLLYAALAKRFDLAPPPYAEPELPASSPPTHVFARVNRWLDAMDARLQALHFRQFLQGSRVTSEEGLRALIRRYLRKPLKTAFDRDKVDFLIVQYFALCAPEQIFNDRMEFGDVAKVLEPILGVVPSAAPSWTEPLTRIVESLKQCQSLKELLESTFIDQSRQLKEAAGERFYDPASLVAFARLNFLLRRSFIRLMHVELRSIRETLAQLEGRAVKNLDARTAGLTAEEPIARLLQVCQEWKQPFRGDYTESTIRQNFAQLLALRAAADVALARLVSGAAPKATPIVVPPTRSAAPAPPSVPGQQPGPARPVEPAARAESGPARPRRSESEPTPATAAPAPQPPKSVAIPASKTPAKKPSLPPLPPSLDLENLGEKIWEQLIADPPARGRSMATVTLNNVRILLSAWEFSAFVSSGGPVSNDLQRAVAARASVAVAMESYRQGGDGQTLQATVAVARAELGHLQMRMDEAKAAKDADAAVNLGISAKRLLAFVEEAENLLP